MKINNLNSMKLNSCGDNEKTTITIDASENITRILKLDVSFTGFCPKDRIIVNITVYSPDKCVVAQSSFETIIPKNIIDANRQVMMALPSNGDYENSEYSILVTYNKIY